MGEWRIHRTRMDQFIRPDLDLYPGFSGGALVGADGKLLGMNSSGLLTEKACYGCPSSTLSRIADEIASKGHVAHFSYIGLMMQPVQIPASLQKSIAAPVAVGLLVMHVEPGHPADIAGVLLGDILLEIDGTSFDDLDDVHEILDHKGAGHEVQATLIRGGQKNQTAIKIGTRPSATRTMANICIMSPSPFRQDWLQHSVAGERSIRVLGRAATFPVLRSLTCPKPRRILS